MASNIALPHPDSADDNLVKYWNDIAGEKEFTSDFDIDMLDKYANGKVCVLDYGCGYGRLMPALLKRKQTEYIGYDPSRRMINQARKRFPDGKFHYSFNTLKKDIPNDGFDAVLFVSVLTAIPSNDAQKKVLENISSLLKPQGLLILNDFLVNRDQRNLERYAEAREKHNYPYGVFETEDGAILRHHTEIHLHTLLEDFFKVLSFENGVIKTMNGNFSNAAKVVAVKK
ncbi:MAG: hypothetical protein Kapaf2KO_18080 [Candidatus Kapaibacteriales bacterium]